MDPLVQNPMPNQIFLSQVDGGRKSKDRIGPKKGRQMSRSMSKLWYGLIYYKL